MSNEMFLFGSCYNKSSILEGIQLLGPYISVTIYDSIIVLNIVFKYFTNAVFLKLPGNNIVNIRDQVGFKSLVFLDLGFNSIRDIRKHCFKTLANLTTVILDNNDITFLESNSFFDVTKLEFLSLSNNPLCHIPKHTLKYSDLTIDKPSIFLSLINMQLFDIDLTLFQDLQVVNTSNYYICCLLYEKTKCTAKVSWYTSGYFCFKYYISCSSCCE